MLKLNSVATLVFTLNSRNDESMSTIKYITIDSPQFNRKRLDSALAILCPELSRTRLKHLILTGQVVMDQLEIDDPAHKVQVGDEYELTIPEPQDPKPKPENIPLDIIYEDKDIIVLNKPAGLVVHPAPGNYTGTLVNALLYHCGASLSGISGERRPGIVHRLDKDTSGLMVVAKNDMSHQNLSAQFAERTLSRTYLAVVAGGLIPPTGTIEANIGRNPKNRQKMAVLNSGGKEAITHYKTSKIFGLKNTIPYFSLVECKLDTGRTHQIRVHMASKGHSIIGDPLYGNHRGDQIVETLIYKNSACKWNNTRQALHAEVLTFIHPFQGKPYTFKVDLPQDMKDLIKILENTYT